jgi:hypothetical protein
MKVSTVRNLRALLTSKQVTFTGDQLVGLVEIIQELQTEEAAAIRRESAPPVELDGGELEPVDHTPSQEEIDAGYEESKRKGNK